MGMMPTPPQKKESVGFARQVRRGRAGQLDQPARRQMLTSLLSTRKKMRCNNDNIVQKKRDFMTMTRLFVILCLQLIVSCLGFVKTPPITKNHCCLKASPSSLEHFQDGGNLEVVLFGIGDLRTDDHEGLKAAIEDASRNKGSKI